VSPSGSPYPESVPIERRELSLVDWTVPSVVDEAPAHGFAVAALTARGAALGQVWQIPRPVVYRAIGRRPGRPSTSSTD